MKGIVQIVPIVIIGIIIAIFALPGLGSSILSTITGPRTCTDTPYAPNCLCPTDQIKVTYNDVVPNILVEYKCIDDSSDLPVTEELVWYMISSSTGGAYCRSRVKDGPMDRDPFAPNRYLTSEECLEAVENYIPEGCVYQWKQDVYGEMVTFSRYFDLGFKFCCNDDKEYHVCGTDGWYIDYSGPDCSTTASKCPADPTWIEVR